MRILCAQSASRPTTNKCLSKCQSSALRGTFITEMYNCSEVINQWLTNSEQPHQAFQKLSKASNQAECRTMCFSGALRSTSKCFSTLIKLQNSIQEYSREYEVAFRMLYNDVFKLLKFRRCWDYETCHQDHSSALGVRHSRIDNI